MSFDGLAPHYRWLERVLAGGLLQRARVAHIAVLDRARHVLLVGEGPGRFLEALRARSPSVSVTVVDASAAMLREAARSIARQESATVELVQADLRVWHPPLAAFDAIVTPCVLDCFGPETLPTIIQRLAGSARPVADWLHIDFNVPPRGWRRARARAVHALMYSVFRAATRMEARVVTSPGPWLELAGFQRLQVDEFSHGLIRSEHWHRLGADDERRGHR